MLYEAMMFKVDQASALITPVKQTDFVSHGYLETRHLEEWFASSTKILALLNYEWVGLPFLRTFRRARDGHGTVV